MTPSVVITGASRGLGLVSAAHLYRKGWRVLAAMRSMDAGMAALRAATGARADDPRLIGVPLDLDDPGSIEAAAGVIQSETAAPFALVHNAGMASVGCLEELPVEVWEQMFRTNLFGPVRLTKSLLPGMREAGKGRVVIVSSMAGARGTATTCAYSAVKGSVERWAEGLAGEISPFGLGVTVLVPGAFRTEILANTKTYADYAGPYGAIHKAVTASGMRMIKGAKPAARFAPAVERALNDRAAYVRRPVGSDAAALVYGSRLIPDALYQRLVRMTTGLPGPGALKRAS